MNAKKVYESIIKLLFNVIRDDELKYKLYKNEEYLEKFVVLIDDLLKLEITNKATYQDLQWAKVFGKAIVIISNEKQRIEMSDKTVTKIYEDYSQFISFTSLKYQKEISDRVGINFTQQDVLDDARLSEEKIKYFEELEQVIPEPNTSTSNQEPNQQRKEEVVEPVAKQAGPDPRFNNPFFGGMPQNLPVPPTADPRFYPYNKKQKWFPSIKVILGLTLLFSMALFLAVSIFIMVQPINFPRDAGVIGGWTITNPDVIERLGGASDIGSINARFALNGQGAGINNIVTLIMWAIIGGWISYALLRKPRNIKEKYRISYWYLVPILILFGLLISSFYNLIDPSSIKDLWSRSLQSWTGANGAETSWNVDEFEQWWALIAVNKHLTALQGLAIAGLVFLATLLLFAIIIFLIQPRLDRAKINRANSEYQQAVSAAMQGKVYEMDPSLFEDEKEVIISKKSKFKLWMEKNTKKKKKE